MCARTWIAPFGIVSAEQIENALAPPPDGSTATKKCMTFSLNSETHTNRQPVRGTPSSRNPEDEQIAPVIAIDPDHPLRLALLEGRDVFVAIHLLAPIGTDPEGFAEKHRRVL